MEHSEAKEFYKKHHRYPERCFICGRWMKKTSLMTFLGVRMCSSCYRHMRKAVEDADPISIFNWLIDRIDADMDIDTNNNVYRIMVKIRNTPKKK